MSTGSGLATIAVERVYDGLVLLAFVALAGPLLLALGHFDRADGAFSTGAMVLAGGVIAVFLRALVLLTLASSPGFGGAVGGMLALVPAGVRARGEGMVLRFIEGLGVLRSPRRQGAVFVLSLPVWLFECGAYLLVACSFGIQGYFESFGVLLLVMLVVTAASNLAAAVPFGVGGIGPFEVATQRTLLGVGVGAAAGGVYAGFLHLVALWLPVNVVGLVLVWRQGLSVGALLGSRSAGGEGG